MTRQGQREDDTSTGKMIQASLEDLREDVRESRKAGDTKDGADMQQNRTDVGRMSMDSRLCR